MDRNSDNAPPEIPAFVAPMRSHSIDNRMVERLWRSLKYECVYLNAFGTGSEADSGIGAWITYYNEKRPHLSHGLLTSAEA